MRGKNLNLTLTWPLNGRSIVQTDGSGRQRYPSALEQIAKGTTKLTPPVQRPKSCDGIAQQIRCILGDFFMCHRTGIPTIKYTKQN